VLIDVNLVLRLVPRPFTIEMMASEVPAAISPYSIAVAPDSSLKNLCSNVMTCGPNSFQIVRIHKDNFAGTVNLIVASCGIRTLDSSSIRGTRASNTNSRAQSHSRQRRNICCCDRLSPMTAKETAMKMKAVTLLATALALTSTVAFAQSGGTGAGASGTAAVGAAPPSGSMANGTTTGQAPSGTAYPNLNAGGTAAGANSTQNPSGNGLLNSSPSGATIGPTSPSGR
jgi:hypothetical protein